MDDADTRPLEEKASRAERQGIGQYDATARAAMSFGHAYVYDHPGCTQEQCAAAVRAKYPWVSDDNVAHVYSQGGYYAWKDGITG